MSGDQHRGRMASRSWATRASRVGSASRGPPLMRDITRKSRDRGRRRARCPARKGPTFPSRSRRLHWGASQRRTPVGRREGRSDRGGSRRAARRFRRATRSPAGQRAVHLVAPDGRRLRRWAEFPPGGRSSSEGEQKPRRARSVMPAVGAGGVAARRAPGGGRARAPPPASERRGLGGDRGRSTATGVATTCFALSCVCARALARAAPAA